MKLLFVLDYIYSGNTTNNKLIKSIADALSQRHEVAFLCNAADEQQIYLKGCNAVFFETYADKASYDIVSKSRAKGDNAFKLVFSLLKKPSAFLNAVSTVLLKRSMAEACLKKQIEKVCAATKYDGVIAVSCPHYVSLALADSKINAKKICYMLDPYWSNKTMSYAVSLKREIKMYKSINCAVITDLMLAENMLSPLKMFKNKMFALPFPAIAEKTYQGSIINFKQDKINCAFVGNLYPQIRSPQYVFDILKKLDKSICLSITGGGYEGFEQGFFEKYKTKLKDRLTLNKAVEATEANDILLAADVLINIGNTVENQLPSKVLEYISTGKPILNFYKIDNCPSLPYFNKYPLALSIKEGDFSAQSIQSINEFCISSKDKKIPFEEIEKLFKECTVQSVSAELESIILRV